MTDMIVEAELWPSMFDPYKYDRAYFTDQRLADVVNEYYLHSARYVLPPDWAGSDYADGEWQASLPHQAIEYDTKIVPLYLT